MKPHYSRFIGIALLTVGIIGLAVTSLNTGERGFFADPGYYPARPGGPPWSQEFGPYNPPQGWQLPEELSPVPGPYYQQPTPEQPILNYDSNGSSIYHTLITLDGEAISAKSDTTNTMHQNLSCASCHGATGLGGYLAMGNRSKVVPAIDRETLWKKIGGGELLRPAYTEATLGQAITQGINSAQRPLDKTMPRFQLKNGDLRDLISYLKTL